MHLRDSPCIHVQERHRYSSSNVCHMLPNESITKFAYISMHQFPISLKDQIYVCTCRVGQLPTILSTSNLSELGLLMYELWKSQFLINLYTYDSTSSIAFDSSRRSHFLSFLASPYLGHVVDPTMQFVFRLSVHLPKIFLLGSFLWCIWITPEARCKQYGMFISDRRCSVEKLSSNLQCKVATYVQK